MIIDGRSATWWRLGVAITLSALVCWAFWQRCSLLFADPYPVGIDGYYYAIQLRELVASGQLYYVSSPVAFWLMAPFAVFTDPIVGAKLGAAAGGALLAVPVYFLGRRLSGDRAIGLLAATLAVASAQSLYLSLEFVKNGIGLTMVATFLCTLLWMVDRPTPRRVVAVVAVLLATAFTHKMAGALAVMWGVPVLYVRASAKQRIALGGAVAAVTGVAVLLYGGDVFRGSAAFGLPALHVDGAKPLRFGYETVIAAVLAVVAAGLMIARPPEEGRGTAGRSFIIGPIAFTLFVAIPWLDIANPQGLAFRLRIVTFLPMALLAAWLAGRATSRLAPYVRSAFVVGFAVGWVMSRPVAEVREGVVRAHPAMELATMAVAGRVPEDAVIIVPSRQTMFMVTWTTRHHARLRPGNVPEQRRWRLVTYALIRSSKPLRQAIRRARIRAPEHIAPPQGLHPGGPDGLVLMPERTWQWVLGRLPEAERRRFDPWSTY